MKYLINLVIKKERSFTETLVYFGLHYLRYILVITLFVAICVFFYRIKIDQEIADLKEKLGYKKNIVETASDMMSEVDAIEKKTSQIKSIIEDQDTHVSMLKYLFEDSRFPKNFSVSQMSVGSSEIVFNGESPSLDDINAFNDRLNKEGKFKEISLSNLKKIETGYKYVFSLKNFQ